MTKPARRSVQVQTLRNYTLRLHPATIKRLKEVAAREGRRHTDIARCALCDILSTWESYKGVRQAVAP